MYRVNTSKTLPFRVDDLHALAADVANYPKFLPWVKAARIWDKSEDGLYFCAELMIGYKNFRIPFSTNVTIDNARKTIKTKNIESKKTGFLGLKSPIKHLDCIWSFEENGDKTNINIQISLEFRDGLIGAIVGANLDRATNKLIDKFTEEAFKRFGINQSLQST